MPSVNDVIVHCQKQIKKEPPAEKLIHYLNRLDRLRVTVQDLMDTGVGRTVNQLSRHDGKVGKFASNLVKKWKTMVSDENSEDSEDSQSSSSSSQESDADGGGDSDDARPLNQENVQNVNGYSNKYENDESGDEFNHEGLDSDDDRLCIADEDANTLKGDKFRNTDGSMIKQERPYSSGEETDVCEDMDQDNNNRDEPVIPEQHSSKYNSQKIKTERLSESDNSDDQADSDTYHQKTQIVPVPHKSSSHNNLNHTNKINTKIGEARKDVPTSHFEDAVGQRTSHKKYEDGKSSLENKSSSHHRSDKDKHKRDRHHSSERNHKRKDKEIYNSSKVKVEPQSEESEDQEDPYQNKHDKGNKHDKEKKKHAEEPRENSRHHKDKKERHGHSHKTKQSHKDKDKSDNNHHRSRSSNNRESSSSNKRKNAEGSGTSSSRSPDRKKIKLEQEFKKGKEHALEKKTSIHIDEEINSTSGVKFEELLGCLDKNLNKSKDKHKDKDKSKKQHSSSSSGNKDKEEVTTLVRRNDLKKKPHDKKRKSHIESVIAPPFNISPNYKPLPSTSTKLLRPAPMKILPVNLNLLETCDPGNYWEDNHVLNNYSKDANTDDALSTRNFVPSSRNQRTKVFSGRAIGATGIVPRLFDLCMQVIQDNIGDLGYTGGVPYEILKPAIERATAQQLLQIEEYNPYLIGSTDDLWRFHCNREFRGRERQEMESWRELYERCIFERNEKFAIVRKKMLKKGEVAVPVRKAKLAYVEPVGGPRFSRQKAATIKNGMKSLKLKEEKGPRKGVGSSASVGFNNPTDSSRIVEEQAVLINPESRAGHAPAPSVSRGEPAARVKPRKAPLMAKTMKFIRTLQRR